MKIFLTNKNKLIITNITLYICIILLLTNSKLVLSSINISLTTFTHSIFPSLFIYILITELLMNSGMIYNLSLGISKILSKIFYIPQDATFILIISYLLGYPNSAKCISKLYNEEIINLKVARKLASFTNNASPAYILCVIGIGMFNNLSVGILLLTSHFLSSIIIGLCFPRSEDIIQQNVTNSNSFRKISFSFNILTISLLNSLKTLGIILGYTIIFSLIPCIILDKLILPEIIKGTIISFFELTSGITILVNTYFNVHITICLISFLLSFSSLMIIFQIYTYLSQANIKLKELILFKFIHGVISSLITYIILKLDVVKVPLAIQASLNLFQAASSNLTLASLYIFIISITVLLLYLTLKKKR